MANLPELDQWEDGIYLLETTDPVLGGPDGVDNVQGKQLANRTLYLKNQLLLKAGLDSPALTGAPTAPTPAPGDNTNKLSTTAFIQAAIATLVNSSPAALDTLNELATALGNDPNFAATMTNALATKASQSGIQQGAYNTAVAAGTADAITASYIPAIAELTNGMTLYVRAGAANTTPTPTFTPNSGTMASKTIVKGNGIALAAGDIAGAGHWIEFQYDSTLDKWVLLNPATGVAIAKSVSAPIGMMRNGLMSVPAASLTATFSAEEIIVETTLGGTAYRLANYIQLINLAATGAGGMDTGAAPASGFVSLYAIAKTDGTKNILACNRTTSAGSIYSGANMPDGYIASALIGMWPTNVDGKFVGGYQIDRTLSFPEINVLNIISSTPVAYTAISIAAAVPPEAKSWGGSGGNTTTSSTNTNMVVAADTVGTAAQRCNGVAVGVAMDGTTGSSVISGMPIITPQTAYYKVDNTNKQARINVSSYTF